MIGESETPAGGGPAEAFSGYYVRLENFEGPLDLLLHLIKKEKIEIWEVSISRITEQYLDYLSVMEALNVEIAGEFLVMAATLMRMKSQRLLPRRPASSEEADELTEEDLVRRLLLYKQFKEAGEALWRRREVTGPRFPRGRKVSLPQDFEYPLEEVDLFVLAEALEAVAKRRRSEEPVHEVQLEEVHIEECMARVLERLEISGRVPFDELFEPGSPQILVAVTFLAILELARQQVVMLLQERTFGRIWVLERSRVHSLLTT